MTLTKLTFIIQQQTEFPNAFKIRIIPIYRPLLYRCASAAKKGESVERKGRFIGPLCKWAELYGYYILQ